MPLLEIGLSHRHVSSDVIARLLPATARLSADLTAAPGIAGAIVLATCNRFEVYVDAETFHGGVDAVSAALAEAGAPDQALLALTVHADDSCVEHLLAVASGLDSMVVGENEILGQVRDAVRTANRPGARLRRLFDAALTTAKAVTTRTTLGAAGRSLVAVGLDVVEGRFGDLTARRVLLIGTGAYARVVAAELSRRGVARARVWSGSGRSAAFADSHDLDVAPDLAKAVAWADVVVTCSGQRGAVLTADLVADARAGITRVLPVLDLSMMNDVAPEVAESAGVAIIDLDEIGRQAPPEQAAAVAAGWDIVRRGVETYLHTEGGRTAVPAVTAMRAHVSEILEGEVAAARRSHSPEVADAVERSLRRVSNALLHTPSVRAAELARGGGLDDYTKALHTLFGIEVPAEARE